MVPSSIDHRSIRIQNSFGNWKPPSFAFHVTNLAHLLVSAPQQAAHRRTVEDDMVVTAATKLPSVIMYVKTMTLTC
jgi:hypothetical protein